MNAKFSVFVICCYIVCMTVPLKEKNENKLNMGA